MLYSVSDWLAFHNQSAAHEDLFVIHCRLEKGTTYNSFLIFGEKTALVDASHEKFRGLYMDTLKEQLKAAGRSLDYVLVSHTEPDHSGLPRPSTPGLPAMLFMGAKDSLAVSLHSMLNYTATCGCIAAIEFVSSKPW